VFPDLLVNHLSFVPSVARLKRGSFAPPELPGFFATMSLSAAPPAAILSMTLRSYSAPASGVLSCHSVPSPHAALITPADRPGTVSVLVRVSPRREFPSRAGLPGTKDRSASADVLFEA